jgi:hypothetical protein
MPYNMRGPYPQSNQNPNPSSNPTMKSSNFSSVEDCLTQVLTCLLGQSFFHNEAEKHSVSNNLRGLGRFHERMEERTAKCYRHLGKELSDHPFNMHLTPTLSSMEHYYSNGEYSADAYEEHLDKWEKSLWEYRKIFTDAAYYLSDQHEVSLYKKMCHEISKIENELWAVGVVKARLANVPYNHPDTFYVMKLLHCYFHDKYDGGDIDFDI